jgi:hypothetical protein
LELTGRTVLLRGSRVGLRETTEDLDRCDDYELVGVVQDVRLPQRLGYQLGLRLTSLLCTLLFSWPTFHSLANTRRY